MVHLGMKQLLLASAAATAAASSAGAQPHEANHTLEYLLGLTRSSRLDSAPCSAASAITAAP